MSTDTTGAQCFSPLLTLARNTNMRRHLLGWVPLLFSAGLLLATAADPVKNYHPQWSPRGDLIVFDSNRDGATHIWVMKPDGSDVVRLTRTGNNSHPSWSPDGDRIVFSSKREGGDWKVHVMNSDRTEQQRLTEGPGMEFATT